MSAQLKSLPERTEYRHVPIGERAAGRWPDIFAALAPDLGPALGKYGKHVSCPIHGGRDGFRLYADPRRSLYGQAVCNTCGSFINGFVLLSALYGWSISETYQRVDLVLAGLPAESGVRIEKLLKRFKQEDALKRRLALSDAVQTLKSSKPVWASMTWPLRRYLDERGIPMHLAYPYLGSDVRYHPELPYFEGGREVDRFPALLAIARNRDGKPCFLHRSWLAKNGHGKAPVSCPRKTTTFFRKQDGAAIRLGGHFGSQGDVAEGIETALSVAIAVERPVWSLVNTSLMSAWSPPDEHCPRQITIWGDKDVKQAGEQAAEALSRNLKDKGLFVSARFPETPIPRDAKSVDWNDVIMNLGVEGFRNTYLWGF
ncbi:DUF7146 domain-containing protein [Acidihalobacter yilgarnensis]|uniref:DUF7146 domain-containing protein n=1 Tax=Acidihalobacter yilgarnensis TaxID=2819280 RepID=UPI0018D34767|nr:toprim domain-containing protein [Acidihalobacter yilgarnensis]